MEPHIYITYDMVFDEEPKSIQQYLKEVDRDVLIKYALVLIQSKGKYESIEDYVSAFFCKENADFAYNVRRIIHEKTLVNQTLQEKLILHSFFIVSENTGLELLRQAFSIEIFDAPLNPILQEQNLFKAILLLNANISKTDVKEELNQDGELSDIFFAKSLLCNSLNNYETSNLGVEYLAIIQIIKGYYFFKFCENSKLKEHLRLFLEQQGFSTWEQYLYNAIKLLLFPLKNEGGYSTILLNDDKIGYTFLHSHAFPIASVISLESNMDYTFFKSHPLIEIDSNTFIPINTLFCVNKLYRSIYFEFRSINEQLRGTDFYIKGRGLRTVFTTDFSEKYLFDKFIRKVFNRQNGKKLSDSECKAISRLGHEPDFYFRSGNNIFLFENKDILVASEIKRCGNYEDIEIMLNRKLINDAGVSQLVHQIKDIANENFIWDKHIPNRPRVYPIIVLDDSSLCVPGLNYVLNAALEEQLKTNNVDIKVYPLAVIELDTLIAFANDFEKGLYKFKDVLDSYYFFQNKSINKVPLSKIMGEVFKKYMPFYYFFSTKFAHKPFDDTLFDDICFALRKATEDYYPSRS